MPGMMPSIPESITYKEYEQQRDCGLLPTSLYQGKPYTVRFRELETPSLEVYAYDMLGIIMKLQHLGNYSLVGAKLRDFNGFGNIIFGVNQNGIMFRHDPLPEDLEEVPFAAEYGYFVGDSDDVSGGETYASESESIRSAEELLGRYALIR